MIDEPVHVHHFQSDKHFNVYIVWWYMQAHISVIPILFQIIYNGTDICFHDGVWR